MHDERTLAGGCLCGVARYTVIGRPIAFWHCHCSRCRRATGTGHASNLFVRGTLAWASGEASVRMYRVDGTRFGTAFCTACGGRVPWTAGANVLVPAGSLDGDPGMLPQGRIHLASRASWSCTGGDGASYDAGPT